MRYIKFKTIITKTFDDIVIDVQDIKAILAILTDKDLDCCLKLKKGPRMEITRILELGESCFKFIVITRSSSLVRRVRYEDIELLEVNDFASDIFVTKPRVSRWMMLEPVSILNPEND